MTRYTLWSQLQASALLEFSYLLCALLLAWYFAKIPAQQPLLWFSGFCQQWLNRRHRRLQKQDPKLIGFCLILCMGFICGLLYLIPLLAAYPWFFEIGLLYLCLNLGGLFQQSQLMAEQLTQGHYKAVQMQLQTLVPFSTQNVTSMGLSKALIEYQLLPCLTIFAVSFSYLCFGLYAALCVRLVILWVQLWPKDMPTLKQLTQPLNQLAQLMLYIPSLIWRLMVWIICLQQPKFDWRSFFRGFDELTWYAYCLGIQLGGPVRYQVGNRIEQINRDKVGTDLLPTAMTVQHVTQLNQKVLLRFLQIMIALWLGYVAWFALTIG